MNICEIAIATLSWEWGLHDFMARAPSQSQVGVVVAARSTAIFGTYPASQQYTETVIN